MARLTLPAVSYFIQFLEAAVKTGTREMTLTAALPGELRAKQGNSVLVSAVPRTQAGRASGTGRWQRSSSFCIGQGLQARPYPIMEEIKYNALGIQKLGVMGNLGGQCVTPGKREPHLKNCLYRIGLGTCLQDIFFIVN